MCILCWKQYFDSVQKFLTGDHVVLREHSAYRINEVIVQAIEMSPLTGAMRQKLQVKIDDKKKTNVERRRLFFVAYTAICNAKTHLSKFDSLDDLPFSLKIELLEHEGKIQLAFTNPIDDGFEGVRNLGLGFACIDSFAHDPAFGDWAFDQVKGSGTARLWIYIGDD
jgi:hypothetical protein